MPRGASYTHDVERSISELMCPIASNIGDGLYQLQMLADALETALKDVRQKIQVLEKAQSDFGTP